MPLPKFVHNKHFKYALGLFLFGITFYVFVIDCSRRPLLDFEVYVAAARGLAQGENIYALPYTVVDRWERQINLYYLYPPLLAHVLSKLSSFDSASAKFAWCLVSYMCVIGSAYCIAELISFSWWNKFSRAQRFLGTYFFTVCFEPVFWGISDGQVTAVLLLLLSFFLLSLHRGRDVAAGISLAAAVMIKMSPLILALALLRFKRWRVLSTFISTCAAIAALSWIDLGGPEIFSDFAASLSGIAEDRSSRGFLFNYVFDKSLLFPFDLDANPYARCMVRAFLLALPLWILWRWPCDDRESELSANAVLLCFMVACSPILWFHHLTWVLLPLAVLSCRKYPDSQRQLKHLTLCVGLYFAISQVNLLHYWTFKSLSDWTWVSSLVPVLLLLLLALLTWRGANVPPHEKPHPSAAL